MSWSWQLVQSQGRTVYHSCSDHPSGLRLAVRQEGTHSWRWSAYASGGPRDHRRSRCVARGESGSWPKARVMARLYADRWQADPSIRTEALR